MDPSTLDSFTEDERNEFENRYNQITVLGSSDLNIKHLRTYECKIEGFGRGDKKD